MQLLTNTLLTESSLKPPELSQKSYTVHNKYKSYLPNPVYTMNTMAAEDAICAHYRISTTNVASKKVPLCKNETLRTAYTECAMPKKKDDYVEAIDERKINQRAAAVLVFIFLIGVLALIYVL